MWRRIPPGTILSPSSSVEVVSYPNGMPWPTITGDVHPTSAMASKAEKEYNERRKELENKVNEECGQYTNKLKKLVYSLSKVNVIHAGLYFLSQYNDMLPFAQEVKMKKYSNMDEYRIPIFSCCVAGLIDNETNEYVKFDIPAKEGINRIEDQLNLDKLKQFRVNAQWFTHIFTEYNYHYYESRQLDVDSPISTIVAWKLEEKIIFICYAAYLDQAQLEISTQVVSSYAYAVFTSEDNNDEEYYKEVQRLTNYFIAQKSPLYDDLYLPSDQEVETKYEKIVIYIKENFEVLECVRYNCSKLAPNQQQFVEYIADQLRTYPNIIENLGQFKVYKEEFEERIKNDFFDDYLEYWYVDFMNITTEHDPDDEKKHYVTDISLTYYQEHRDKWLESYKVLLKGVRYVADIVEKRSDKTELSFVFELTKYFMENITLYKNNNEQQPKYHRKNPDYYRKFRSRQENENKLLFQVDKQPDKWTEPYAKKKEKETKKDPSTFKCQPRDILAPFVDQNATSESLAKAFKLVLDVTKINSVIVFGETCDKIGEFWNKVCINQDWANMDCYRCCYLNDYRYFMIDDEFLGYTHVGIAGEEEKYPKCYTLKLSYFSMARTLISETNLEYAVELITNQAIQGIKDKTYCTDQFCFTCPVEERNRLLGNFSQVDDAVSREIGINMRCDSWAIIQGDEKRNFLVVKFYFEPL